MQSASGLLLLVATAVALLFVNLGDAEAWHHLWETPLGLSLGDRTFSLSLHAWINDGLMAIFFFVVGLEIKREIVSGELSEWRAAALPIVAAIGGAAVPALVYLVLPAGSAHPSGWAVPMATDIAFVVGVLALFGDRVPAALRVLMLTIAIVDDLIAVVVIAAFYSDGISWPWLGAAGLGIAIQIGFVRLGARSWLLFLPLAIAVWACTLQAGIHPTVAGVALALTIPQRPLVGAGEAARAVQKAGRVVEDEAEGPHETHLALQQIARFGRRSVPPLDKLEEGLAPWTSFVIMPLFALANAGVVFSSELFVHPVTIGTAAGLVVGKPLGLIGLTALAVWAGLARLPEGISRLQLASGGALAGIGFTMSLFIASLGLADDALAAARTGILLGSVLAGALGAGLLWFGAQPGENRNG